jgi:hypothetical protein
MEEIRKDFTERNCELLEFTNKNLKLKYLCECGIIKEKLYRDFMKGKECRTCTTKKLNEKPDHDFIEDGHEWKAIIGGWISDHGKCKNVFKKDLTLCPTKFRYNIGGKAQYAPRLMAEAFQIENYEKLQDPTYCVINSNIDKNNMELRNLKVGTRTEVNTVNGSKSRQSETFKEKNMWSKDKFAKLDSRIVPEFPFHTIYENGEIWNGSRFLVFSHHGGYLSVCFKETTVKLHRLIAYAFHPIDSYVKLSDYNGFEVNHKDGNTLNNNAVNLEWTSHKDNMQHAYDTKLNNKTRVVRQFSIDKKEFLAEYGSIAEASRQTGDPEHTIRDISNGRTNTRAIYYWEFKNPEESKKFSEKYFRK